MLHVNAPATDAVEETTCATECRACGSHRLEEVLDLGRMPLAGDFKPVGETNTLHPLAVDTCAACAVLQVRQQIPHSVIFSPSYSYASSTVPGLVRHFKEFAGEVAIAPGVRRPLLLEVGCNDGVFLEPLIRSGYQAVGIDACENVVAMARAKGLDVTEGVFGRRTAVALKDRFGPFDVVTCSNVFAHNFALQDFLDGVDLLLESPTSEFWVEVHSAQRLYDELQWDCFYHEHCFYWSIHSLRRCLLERGFHLQRYKTVPMHGGALRAVFSRSKYDVVPQERELSSPDWTLFGARCRRSRDVIRSVFNSLPLRYAYGAAGRAVTLINWTGIASQLEFAVDASPLRYGKAIPNTRVPIISESEFLERREGSEWCFVAAHNYLPDIRKKVDAAFPDRTLRYVTPLPHVAIQ